MVLLNIIGGVCFLLWGLRAVRNGMTRAFGADLHSLVSKTTGNRFTAFISGVGVTALLQSSTATAFIIAAFCGQGVLSLSSGLAVMLGADVGTAVVAQALSYDLSWLAPLLIISGYVLYAFNKSKGKFEHIGKLLMGLALMLFSLMWIKQSAEPLKESEVLAIILQSLDSDPIMALLIVAFLTWLSHSSLAIVLLLASLVISGVLPTDVGLVMVVGANIGGAIVPILATLRDSREATRVPVGNLIMRLFAAAVALPFITVIHEELTALGSTPERLIVDFHMAFNLALALFFIPFTSLVAKLSEKIVPRDQEKTDPAKPMYLDEKELGTPSIALSAAMRETLRMADVLQKMLEQSIVVLRDNDDAALKKIRKQDDIIDGLYKSVKLYLAKMTRESLDPDEADQHMQVLSFASNIENAGDLIDKSLMEMGAKKIDDKKKFSKEGAKEIEDIHNFVVENVKLAQNVFMSGDSLQARRLLEGKEELRVLEQKATHSHMERIAEGVSDTIATSSMHLDIIRDYRRINSYLTSVAYPILEERGELRSSRLKRLKKK